VIAFKKVVTLVLSAFFPLRNQRASDAHCDAGDGGRERYSGYRSGAFAGGRPSAYSFNGMRFRGLESPLPTTDR
jgi:hypothetical protein